MSDVTDKAIGKAVLECTPAALAKIFGIVLDDHQSQIDSLKEDGADEEDSKVKRHNATIDNTCATMKAERIRPPDKWRARYDAKVAADKEKLKRQRDNAEAARRKLQNMRDHADSEAELRLSRRTMPKLPEESA